MTIPILCKPYIHNSKEYTACTNTQIHLTCPSKFCFCLFCWNNLKYISDTIISPETLQCTLLTDKDY